MTEPENALRYRLEALEASVASLKQQLERYVPLRENELQLQNIRGTVENVQRNVTDMSKQIQEISSRLISQDADSQKRDTAQRESQADTQIKVLRWAVALILGSIASIIVGYASHFLH